MFSRKRRAIIAAGHACMKKGSGEWWAFIRHQGRRGSKKIGSSKTKALAVADIINIRLALSQVGLDLCQPGKKTPPPLKFEHIRQLKRCLAGTPKRAIPSEIPSWALEIVEHQVLWGRLAVHDSKDKGLALETGNQRSLGDESQTSLQALPAHRKGEDFRDHSREEILEAAVELTETYGTRKRYDQVQIARRKLADLMYRAESDSHESASQPKSETNANPEKFPPETRENFSKPDPKPPARQRRSQKGDALEKGTECCLGNKGQILLQALPAQSPKPKRERILYEQTRKRKEFKEALRKRYSPRMGYRS
jgi:hypothetical protein